jgi:hypothetical protein
VRRQRIDVRAHTTAHPDTVYALLRDGASWPSWSPIGSFELERRADGDDPEGLGAIRVFRSRWRGSKVTSREQVVEVVPGRRFSYTLLSGLPLRDYRADVDLEPTEDGTTIHWRSSFLPKVLGTGWLYRRILTEFIEACASGLAAHAARRRPDVSHGL